MPSSKRFGVKMTSILALAETSPDTSVRSRTARTTAFESPESDEEFQSFIKSNTAPHPSNWHEIFLVLTGILASLCIYIVVLSPLNNYTKIQNDFTLAKKQSFGFFDDISSEDWMIMRQRIRDRKNHLLPDDPERWMTSPHAWYQHNWEPDFACQHERRVGGMGDGPKWVCDPHRVPAHAKERVKQGGNGCLIYSVGSAGNFEFELGLQREFGKDECEIHIFDPAEMEKDTQLPEGMHYHAMGLESSDDMNKEKNFKSFQEIVTSLGHQGRTIDIFKIDCEGCEWRTYKDWFDADVSLLQILVEVHFSPSNANDFFETLQKEGYVTFHKEPNIIFGGGNCQEYALLKLDKGFYEK